jgi:hypothetical protein
MTVQFNNSIENMDYSKDYSYLLNFWHTTKLNKELEFIKRNGIHPSVVSVIKNGANEVTVSEGNSIETNFYTVYRIFLENIFKEVKALKTRGLEEWSLSFKPGTDGLDTYSFLIANYAKINGIASDIISFPQRYGQTSISNIKIRLNGRDQLHAKAILNTLENYEVEVKRGVDENIRAELDELMPKLKRFLNYPESKTEKVTKKTAYATLNSNGGWNVEERGGAYATPRTDLATGRPVATPRGGFGGPLQTAMNNAVNNSALNELLPVYRNLNSSLGGMQPRTRFSYILSYAKAGGTNMLINQLEDTENNFRAFMVLTNNMPQGPQPLFNPVEDHEDVYADGWNDDERG